MIEITPTLAVGEDEIVLTFVRSAGPGGQNVNKVATACQLRFDVARSPSLPAAVKERLIALAGARATRDGEIVISAGRFRTQEANRRDAIGRLVALIRRATVVQRRRVATRPTGGSVKRRLQEKTERGEVKRGRGKPRIGEE